MQQGIAAGLSPAQIGRRVRVGKWHRMWGGVYRLAGVPQSWEQSLLAACLAGHRLTAASHRAAARLHRLDGFRSNVVEVTGSRLRSKGIRCHRGRLEASEVTKRQRIPVTVLERTLRDLGSVVPCLRVEEALDSALRKERTTVPRLQAALSSNSAPGRNGAGVLRRLLADRDPDGAVPESRFETRLAATLRKARLPTPTKQHIVHEDGRFIARCDFAYPDHSLAIEAMSLRWHFGREAFERDMARRNALTSIGWRIIEITWGQVTLHPSAVTSLVAKALGYAELL